jgi:hypothetical protein
VDLLDARLSGSLGPMLTVNDPIGPAVHVDVDRLLLPRLVELHRSDLLAVERALIARVGVALVERDRVRPLSVHVVLRRRLHRVGHGQRLELLRHVEQLVDGGRLRFRI